MHSLSLEKTLKKCLRRADKSEQNDLKWLFEQNRRIDEQYNKQRGNEMVI